MWDGQTMRLLYATVKYIREHKNRGKLCHAIIYREILIKGYMPKVSKYSLTKKEKDPFLHASLKVVCLWSP